MLIDTHAHLDASEFAPDRDAVVDAARAQGVGCIVVPGVSWENLPAVLATCRRYALCVPALGLHPLYVGSHRPEHLAGLREWVARERPVAIGEIGLDYYVPGVDPAAQAYYFVEQLRIARAFDLPVLLHVRKAHDQALKLLRRMGVDRGIAHAFNGSAQQAQAFIKQGFKLGFGGALTFPRALKLRALARELPLGAIVLETDAPDIPPIDAGRGRNSPQYLRAIAQCVADLRAMPFEDLAEATTINAREVLALRACSGGTG
ncbi:MAG: TatD family hydrolase [Betaproteobacteria bacterium]|nr:TatD family hydrolase [Betaproteobacteria bacterium]